MAFFEALQTLHQKVRDFAGPLRKKGSSEMMDLFAL
jgi:hypothetical protein